MVRTCLSIFMRLGELCRLAGNYQYCSSFRLVARSLIVTGCDARVNLREKEMSDRKRPAKEQSPPINEQPIVSTVESEVIDREIFSGLRQLQSKSHDDFLSDLINLFVANISDKLTKLGEMLN